MKKSILFATLVLAHAFLFMLFPVRLNAQTELWGMTSDGGLGNGAIIKLNTDGSGFANFAFENQGVNPYSDLLESGGKFYGLTSDLNGVLFEYDPAGGGTYTVKHQFDGSNGGFPQGSLIASDGKFYGMTYYGGTSGDGVLFEYDPTSGGTYTVKHHFDDTNGANPEGSLIASGGKFYGMTRNGGISGIGTLFEYDPAGGGTGTYTVKHHFSDTNGGNPHGSLIASGGKFYGMTYYGGSGSGVLFEYDPTGGGTYTIRHHFDNTNGGNPAGSLIESDGKFYGMTYSGGSSDDGVIFEYEPAGGGTYTVKHHFDKTNGGNPHGSLLESDGRFYGMTHSGGISDDGVIFEYDPAGGGTYTVKLHFDGSNGSNPLGSLIASDGKFYGMTQYGGISGLHGVLFEYDPAGVGAYTVRHHFANTTGGHPTGGLIASGGKFYGMTVRGGSGGYGALFEYDPAGGGTYTVRHHFDYATGGAPRGSLVALNGKFYGTTATGGISGLHGVLFEYDPAGAGTYTVKHHFVDAFYGSTVSSLLVSGGKLYGLIPASYGYGVLFEYDPAGGGTYTVKHHFDEANGCNPLGSLIESDGKFYGMAHYSESGATGYGVLFEYDPAGAGTYTVKHHFDGTNGGYPWGRLLESGGKFYGMTPIGGSNGKGVLFEYDPAGGGAYTIRHHFDNTNGVGPHGSLIASGGKFYGMTGHGGNSNGGVVFEYDPAGAGNYTVLRHLEYADGINPYGDLIAVAIVNTTTPVKSQPFEIQVSPNPSSDHVSIEIFSEKALPGNLAIFDLQGRLIALLAKDKVFHGQERIVWQPADQVHGVFLIRLELNGEVVTRRIVLTGE